MQEELVARINRDNLRILRDSSGSTLDLMNLAGLNGFKIGSQMMLDTIRDSLQVEMIRRDKTKGEEK